MSYKRCAAFLCCWQLQRTKEETDKRECFHEVIVKVFSTFKNAFRAFKQVQRDRKKRHTHTHTKCDTLTTLKLALNRHQCFHAAWSFSCISHIQRKMETQLDPKCNCLGGLFFFFLRRGGNCQSRDIFSPTLV